MFDQVKRLLHDLSGTGEQAVDEGDYRLAVAALLVHVANADGITTPAEAGRLHALLARRFDLDREAGARLLADAARRDADAVDLFHFTNVLKRRLDDEGRREVVGLMWEIVYADGVLDEFEDNVVFRVAELLGVSTNDRVALRLRAARGAGVSGPSGAAPTKTNP